MENTEKHRFETQHYYLKWLCALPLVGLALGIEFLIARAVSSDIVFYLSCALVMGGLLTAYYLVSDRLGWFRDEGRYWEEDGRVVIELGKRRHEIGEVSSLMGGDPNIFLYRYAYLLIETPEEKLKIFGRSLHGQETFRDSDLWPLFRLILEGNSGLVPKQVLGADIDDWYVKR